MLVSSQKERKGGKELVIYVVILMVSLWTMNCISCTLYVIYLKL